MIPSAFLQAWSAVAPWPDLRQIEQDLIICRALCDLFTAPALKDKIAFRGGTAINKLLLIEGTSWSPSMPMLDIDSRVHASLILDMMNDDWKTARN